MGLKVPISDQGLIFLVTSSHPAAIERPVKSCLIRAKDTLSLKEVMRTLGALCRELGKCAVTAWQVMLKEREGVRVSGACQARAEADRPEAETLKELQLLAKKSQGGPIS